MTPPCYLQGVLSTFSAPEAPSLDSDALLILNFNVGGLTIPMASAGTSLAAVHSEPQALCIHLAMKQLHLAPHSFNK